MPSARRLSLTAKASVDLPVPDNPVIHKIGAAVAMLGLAPALAADMAPKYTKAPMAAPMVIDNWSGFYIGAGTGGVWTTAHRFMPDLPLVGVPPTLFTAHSSDWIYNAHVGAQRQWGRWVFGVEAAYNGTQRNMRANVSVSPPEPFTTS